jgi:ribonuclease HI
LTGLLLEVFQFFFFHECNAGHEGNECADNLAREGMTELDGNGDL